MTDCVFRSHFEMKSADGVCDLCGKPYCNECGSQFDDTCYQCAPKIMQAAESKVEPKLITSIKNIRDVLRRFNAFQTYAREDFQAALQEISLDLDEVGY